MVRHVWVAIYTTIRHVLRSDMDEWALPTSDMESLPGSVERRTQNKQFLRSNYSLNVAVACNNPSPARLVDSLVAFNSETELVILHFDHYNTD